MFHFIVKYILSLPVKRNGFSCFVLFIFQVFLLFILSYSEQR